MADTKLVFYNNARKALAACVRKDEAATLRNKAIAMEVYARQAKDSELIAMATEIRKRAERRLGELMAEERKAGKLAKGGGPGRGKKGKNRVAKRPGFPALAEQGIDKHLADRARKAAALPEREFEKAVNKAVRVAVAATENDKAVIAEARAERHAKKQEARAAKERDLAAKISALPDKKFAVVLADPPWRWEAWSKKGLDATSADNHYPTGELDEIKGLDISSIAANDCVLFLWATVPMTPHALEVMQAWGFKYVSHFVWVKDRTGTGYWNRNQHELLLIGTRGNIPAPAEGSQFPSVIEAPVGKHSEKPEAAFTIIETYYKALPKIELYRRCKARRGWAAWGNEAIAA